MIEFKHFQKTKFFIRSEAAEVSYLFSCHVVSAFEWLSSIQYLHLLCLHLTHYKLVLLLLPPQQNELNVKLGQSLTRLLPLELFRLSAINGETGISFCGGFLKFSTSLISALNSLDNLDTHSGFRSDFTSDFGSSFSF